MAKNVSLTNANIDREVSRLVVGQPVRVDNVLGLNGLYEVKAAGSVRIGLDADTRASRVAQMETAQEKAIAEGCILFFDDLPQGKSIVGAVLTDSDGTDHVVGASVTGFLQYTVGSPITTPSVRLWEGYELN